MPNINSYSSNKIAGTLQALNTILDVNGKEKKKSRKIKSRGYEWKETGEKNKEGLPMGKCHLPSMGTLSDPSLQTFWWSVVVGGTKKVPARRHSEKKWARPHRPPRLRWKQTSWLLLLPSASLGVV